MDISNCGTLLQKSPFPLSVALLCNNNIQLCCPSPTCLCRGEAICHYYLNACCIPIQYFLSVLLLLLKTTSNSRVCMSLGLYAQAGYKITCCSLVMINLNNQQKILIILCRPCQTIEKQCNTTFYEWLLSASASEEHKLG